DRPRHCRNRGGLHLLGSDYAFGPQPRRCSGLLIGPRLPATQSRETTMDLHLKGKNAIILGGTRGIGRAIADTLADEGANVAICARKADQVAETVAALRALGVKATGASVDIMHGEALKAWIAAAGAELGGIDILVSNAGAMAVTNDPVAWEQNFRLDVLGMVNAFEAAKPMLLEAAEKHGDASFVIISSVSAAETDSPGAYGPMKAALI